MSHPILPISQNLILFLRPFTPHPITAPPTPTHSITRAPPPNPHIPPHPTPPLHPPLHPSPHPPNPLGTASAEPQRAGSRLYAQLRSRGFDETWVRTDYRFDSKRGALEALGFFFGKVLLFSLTLTPHSFSYVTLPFFQLCNTMHHQRLYRRLFFARRSSRARVSSSRASVTVRAASCRSAQGSGGGTSRLPAAPIKPTASDEA